MSVVAERGEAQCVKGIKPSLYTRKVDIYTALPTGGDLVTLSSELQSQLPGSSVTKSVQEKERRRYRG